MSSSSDKDHLTSKLVSLFKGGNCAINDWTWSWRRRDSTPFKFTASSEFEIFSIALSIDLLDCEMSLAFSEKKPLFSLSVVTEPVAIVLIVSTIVFFAPFFFEFCLSIWFSTDSPHYERIVYLVFWTSWATLLTTDSKRWKR